MDEGLLKTSITGSAIVSRPLELSVLRSLLDEHHFCTIYSICLFEKKKSKISSFLLDFASDQEMIMNQTDHNSA